MARVQALLSVSVVVFAAIAFAAFFPQECQLVLFKGLFSVYKAKHEFIQRDGLPNPGATLSASALAFEDLLRSTPIPEDTHKCRKLLDSFGILAPIPSTTHVEAVKLRSDLGGFWVTPAGTNVNASVILYLHGGAFISGSPSSHLGFVAELAARTGTRGFFIHYRLAPEHILPAQIEDAVFAYKHLVNTEKISPRRLVVVGDSAGGGMTLSTILALQHEEHGRYVPPAAAVTISAWTDLCSIADGRPSVEKNKDRDVVISKKWICHQAGIATGTAVEEYEKRKSPKLSPIYASLDDVKFPPLFMQVGTAEILKDDTTHFAGKAKQAGIDVTLQELEGLQHNAALAFNYIDEAKGALSSIVDFIQTHTKH